MNFFWDAFLAAVFSAVSIIVLKYICIKSSDKIIKPVFNVVALGCLLGLIVFIIGNLRGHKYFEIVKPSLDIQNYENKMFWIAIAYFIIIFIVAFFSVRSFYYVSNPAFTQAVIYSNIVIIYLFSTYFFGSKLTIQSALGILLVFIGICLITTNKTKINST